MQLGCPAVPGEEFQAQKWQEAQNSSVALQPRPCWASGVSGAQGSHGLQTARDAGETRSQGRAGLAVVQVQGHTWNTVPLSASQGASCLLCRAVAQGGLLTVLSFQGEAARAGLPTGC